MLYVFLTDFHVISASSSVPLSVFSLFAFLVLLFSVNILDRLKDSRRLSENLPFLLKAQWRWYGPLPKIRSPSNKPARQRAANLCVAQRQAKATAGDFTRSYRLLRLIHPPSTTHFKMAESKNPMKELAIDKLVIS